MLFSKLPPNTSQYVKIWKLMTIHKNWKKNILSKRSIKKRFHFNKWDLEDELCSYALSCIYKIIGLWIFFCLTGSSSIQISFPPYFNYLDAAVEVYWNYSGCSDGELYLKSVGNTRITIPFPIAFQNLSQMNLQDILI